MSAVVRVKRRVTEDPLEAFVLNSKRRREEQVTADKDEVSTILKFAGTVQNQTEGLSQATKLSKDDARAIVSRVRREPLDQLRQKKRDEQRQNAHNERFRIVNCSRTTAQDDREASASDGAAAVAKEITVLDIEKDCRLGSGTGEAELAQESSRPRAGHSQSGEVVGDYVYDLYVPDVEIPELEWSEHFLQNMLRVEPYDLMFDHFRDPERGEESDADSEDSNQENHYGNEYPDSDESTGERAMRRAMDAMQLEEDLESSSDDEDFYEGPTHRNAEEYVHTLEVDEPGFMPDVDFEDTANRYGDAYAKYKKKILKAFANAKEVPTDDEEGDSDRSSASGDYYRARGSDDDDEECYSESEMDKFG